MMKQEIADLEETRLKLVPIEEADRLEARTRALHDGGDGGRLRLRYIGEAQRDLYRALKEVREIQRDKAKRGPHVFADPDDETTAEEGQAAGSPTPARNEPNYWGGYLDRKQAIQPNIDTITPIDPIAPPRTEPDQR